MIEGGVLGWMNPWVLVCFAGCAISAAAFVLQERRARQPMLPLVLFKNKLFALTSIVGLLTNIAFYGLIFVLSLYFQKVNGLSPFATGMAFVPMMGAVLPANLLAARAAERLGAPVTIACGAAITAIGCIGLLGLGRGTSYWAICGQLLAMGAGLGLLVPPLTSTLLGSVEKARSGIAAGVLNSTRQTGSVVGVALFGSLVGKADEFLAGTREALVISATILVCAAIMIVTAGRSDSRRRPSSASG
jgi:DHA2 family methylenomycin A resistance protein-like MFS transporter